MRSVLIWLASALLVNACSTQAYRDTKSGSFRGVLDVRWVKNDFFIFIPSKTDPLTFTRSNGKPIQPGIMYTDGGSIPQFLWGVEGYSPWGYAPAYITTTGCLKHSTAVTNQITIILS